MAEYRIPFQVAHLILKSFTQTLNPQEQQTIDSWLTADAQHPKLLEMLQEEQQLDSELAFLSSLETEKAWQKVKARTTLPAREISLWQRLGVWKYAAAVTLLLGIVLVFALVKQQESGKIITAVKPQPVESEIKPGGDKVRLAMADGTEIFLDDIANGTVREMNGIKIEKQGEQVIFRVTGTTAGQADNTINTVSTPVGGKYQVVLPDGSNVWLNAASALSFPASFSGRERAVTLTGEGYFEITTNKNKPFKVTANRTVIEVLGTHFNLMAYPEEDAVKATLLEGAVKVSNGKSSEVIKPGQQASIGEQIKLAVADVDEAIAWKNGLFYFNETDLQTIGRQLERWYNVDITFAGEVPARHFTGVISRRSNNIEQVLKMLCLSGNISYKIKEKSILISAKKGDVVSP